MPRIRRRRRGGDATAGDDAVLSSSAIVDADPGARRNLIVEGRINAEVPLHAHGVAIGPTGRVSGDIYGAMIRVEGEVVGDLYGRVQVLVCCSASVRGDITAPKVIIEEGARFKGQIRMEEPPELVAPGLGSESPAIVSV